MSSDAGTAYHELGELSVQLCRVGRHRFRHLQGHQLEAAVVGSIVRYFRLTAAKTPAETVP